MRSPSTRRFLWIVAFAAGMLLGTRPVFALDPSLDISQYAHATWTVRDGFSLGNIYAMAQTPDGYLWLGGEFGLVRFDGVRSVPWRTPAGQQFPDRNINALLATRDGTLWIGTFAGLLTWSTGGLIPRPEHALAKEFVASLFEDSEGTVWVGLLGAPTGRLCAIRKSGTECYGDDNAFGRAVWAFYEDSSGTLWAAAESGLWRIKTGPPKRYRTSTELIGLNKTDKGQLLVAIHGAGLLELVGNKLESYPVRGPINSKVPLRDRDVDANRILRDRDGGLWIGTVERGLIHVHHGRTDVFKKADGLSGDVVLGLFEDREGNIWVSTTGGLDRFHELSVATVSVKQGLSSDATQAVLAATDGSVWVASHEGLTLLQNGKATIFGKTSGLSDYQPESLFQDASGRVWLSMRDELAYLKGGRFVTTAALRSGKVYCMSGDKSGNLWLSTDKALLHLRDGLLVERHPWSALGRQQQANWIGGGVSYFKNGQIRMSYTTADGLGQGPVPDLRLDMDRALWAATEYGGLSRIKDGRIATLTTRNGLPCDTINGTIEDDDRSLWLYTVCSLVRIKRTELDAWIAHPERNIEMTVWDAADGVRLRSSAASEYSPRVTKSTDGKLWFVTGEGIQVVDPHHLPVNKLQPPVHIEQVVADRKTYWQNSPGMPVGSVQLPPLARDLEIDFTALSLVAPEKIHFRYKLEGQDSDWRETINERHALYTNLAPGSYRFRVTASNNSGVWNEQGDMLKFSLAPAYYQTNWFRSLCLSALLIFLWAAYLLRVRQLQKQFHVHQ